MRVRVRVRVRAKVKVRVWWRVRVSVVRVSDKPRTQPTSPLASLASLAYLDDSFEYKTLGLLHHLYPRWIMHEFKVELNLTTFNAIITILP